MLGAIRFIGPWHVAGLCGGVVLLLVAARALVANAEFTRQLEATTPRDSEHAAHLRRMIASGRRIRRSMTVTATGGACLAGFHAVMLAARLRAHRAAARQASGLCPACGYDLRATPGRCPECGTPAPAAR